MAAFCEGHCQELGPSVLQYDDADRHQTSSADAHAPIHSHAAAGVLVVSADMGLPWPCSVLVTEPEVGKGPGDGGWFTACAGMPESGWPV